jgi:hypothetical protein
MKTLSFTPRQLITSTIENLLLLKAQKLLSARLVIGALSAVTDNPLIFVKIDHVISVVIFMVSRWRMNIAGRTALLTRHLNLMRLNSHAVA